MISSYFLMTISIFLCLEYCDVGSKGVMSYFRCIGKYHSGNIYYWQFFFFFFFFFFFYFRCIGKYHSGNIYYWQFVVSLLLLNPLLSICPFFKNYCAVVIFFLLCLFSIALNFIQTKVGILLNLFKCSR